MDGSVELARLAELLRVGARTGRQIAFLRPRDAAEIDEIAGKVEKMADDLESIAGRGLDLVSQLERPN